MTLRFLRLAVIGIVAILMNTACAPQAAQPSDDKMGTAVARAAADLLTQTAAASSPTPSATSTSKPTPTQTPTITPTSAPPKAPIVVNFAGCWRGPSPSYVLVSNISKGQRVDLIGIGSVSGWYIIVNPYFHQACWIQAANLSIHVGTDLSKYPVMTPMPLTTPGP